MLIFLDLVLVITHGSCGWKRVRVIACSKVSYFWTAFFLVWSQIITFLSSPPEQIKFISRLSLAELTQCVCPTYELLNFKVSISHSFIVLSIHPLTIIRPSLEKSKDRTGAVCPLIVLVFTWVPGYHKFIVLS